MPQTTGLSDVDVVKDKADIIDTVSSYVTLKKSGRNLSGLCPFHKEKSPSFIVSPERQSYKCFGCGVGGDVLSFVQAIEGLSFPETLKHLAEKYGLKLSGGNLSGPKKSDKDRLLKKMSEVISYYEDNLNEDKEAQAYLKKRSVNGESIRNWRIGYAKDDWRTMFSQFADNKADLVSLGLIKTPEEGKVYDVFRHRITFPIADNQGNIIAISGRAQGDVEPKYLNSPETVLFNKSKTLYGYDQAKQHIRRQNYAIIVEGQFDLVLCHQVGLKNTVATSGTAITADHVKLLSRLTQNLLLLFDSDTAGQLSAIKAAKLAMPLGCQTKIASTPEDTDPADLAADDPEKIKAVVRQAAPLFIWLADKYQSKSDSEPTQKKWLEDHILPLLAAVPGSVNRHKAIEKTAKLLAVPDHILATDVEAVLEKRISKNNDDFDQDGEKSSGEPTVTPTSQIEKKVTLLFAYLAEYKQTLNQKLVTEIHDKLQALFSDQYLSHAKIRSADTHTETLTKPDEYLWDLLETIETAIITNNITVTNHKIRIAQNDASASLDTKHINDLTIHITDLVKKRDNLKQDYVHAYKKNNPTQNKDQEESGSKTKNQVKKSSAKGGDYHGGSSSQSF